VHVLVFYPLLIYRLGLGNVFGEMFLVLANAVVRESC